MDNYKKKERYNGLKPLLLLSLLFDIPSTLHTLVSPTIRHYYYDQRNALLKLKDVCFDFAV